MATVDHRRATAERNVESILDAAERLMRTGASLSISAAAAEAGVSRVTVYAHFPKLPDLVEAVVKRSVDHATAALGDAALSDGTPASALDRMVDAAWEALADQDAIARAAAEHLSADAMRRSHEHSMAPLAELIERGRADGSFRTDLPTAWLLTATYALVHAAADEVRAGRLEREQGHA